MSKTKVIEIFERTKMVVQIGTDTKGNVVTTTHSVDELRTLNSDYINEHFPTILQDEYDRGYKDGRNVTETQAHNDAYQRGLEDGKKAFDLLESERNSEYERGLNDAWEAARKIACDEGIDMNTLCTIFKKGSSDSIIRDFSVSEAIEKLKAYEEKQKADDEIMVGDEVVNNTTGTKGILLEPETQHLLATVIIPSQRWRTFNASHVNLKKTGKHYDIKKLLEAVKA